MVNVWRPEHFIEVTKVLGTLGLENVIDYHLSSPVSTNLFLEFSVDERVEFVRNTLNSFNRSETVLRALSIKPYAPYLLLDLIERDSFMKLQSFEVFDRAVEETSSLEVDIISKGSRDNDDKYLKFYKYINILSEDDERRVHGKKFIDLISSTATIKGLAGQSLHIFDNYSQVFEEHEGDVDEGPTARIQTRHATVNGHLNRAQIRDFSWPELYQLIVLQKEDEAIELIKRYKISDLTAGRGLINSSDTVVVDTVDENGDFIPLEVFRSELNVLQNAIISENSRLVHFLLSEYKILTPGSKTVRGIDSRILFLNNIQPNDATLTIRLLAKSEANGLSSDRVAEFIHLYTQED